MDWLLKFISNASALDATGSTPLLHLEKHPVRRLQPTAQAKKKRP